MIYNDPNKDVIKGGKTLLIVNNDFDGKTHGIVAGMTCVICNDGWYQVFKKNSHLKHFTRLSPDFVNYFEKNFKQV